MSLNKKSVSPCAGCDWHLSGGCKNRQECEDCKDRMQYDQALDSGRPYSMGVPSGKQPVQNRGPATEKNESVCMFDACGRPAGYDGYCVNCRRRIQRRIERGVDPYGSDRQSRISDSVRREIQEKVLVMGLPQVKVARQYQVNQSTVSKLVKEANLR